MIPTNPYVLLVIIGLSIGYAVAPKVEHGVKKVGHAIVHVVTLGKK